MHLRRCWVGVGLMDQITSGERDSGLLSLCVLSQFLGLPLDPSRLRAQVGAEGPVARHDLVRLARQLGFEASDRKLSSWKGLTGLRLPALVEGRDGGFFLLARSPRARR